MKPTRFAIILVPIALVIASPAALAQSSVTISGFFKMSLDNQKIGQSPRLAGLNSSETRLADDSSRVIFNVAEDLGGGLAAIAQLEWRIAFDQGSDNIGGNNHVGLRSKTMGRIIVGRQDLHYLGRESNLTDLAGSQKADSISLLAYAGGGATAIAAATRTPNVIQYTSPNWGGFTLAAAYSTSPNPGAAVAGVGAAGSVTESDIGTTVRKGNAFNLNPTFVAPNWQVGYSYWNQKNDGGIGAAALATAAGGDQRADRLYGSFKVAGFKLGLAWDKSRIKSAAGATSGTELSNRTAWSLPLSYVSGNNQFHFHYTKARDDSRTVEQDGAKMVALSYQYLFSKRTSVGITYAKITNDAGANYNFYFTGSLGSASAVAAAGEDPRMIAGTLRHAF